MIAYAVVAVGIWLVAISGCRSVLSATTRAFALWVGIGGAGVLAILFGVHMIATAAPATCWNNQRGATDNNLVEGNGTASDAIYVTGDGNIGNRVLGDINVGATDTATIVAAVGT